MTRINFFSVKQVKESGTNYDLPVKSVNSPHDAFRIIQTVLNLEEEAQEVFGIVTLNTKNIVAGFHIIGKGSLNACVVHPREVFKAAILNNAASFICFHNHPSGDPTPSSEDIQLTKRLSEVGEVMGIEVLDHIVVGDGNRYTSLKEQGLF